MAGASENDPDKCKIGRCTRPLAPTSRRMCQPHLDANRRHQKNHYDRLGGVRGAAGRPALSDIQAAYLQLLIDRSNRCEPMPTAVEISAVVGCSPTSVKTVASAVEAKGYIATVIAGRGRRAGLAIPLRMVDGTPLATAWRGIPGEIERVRDEERAATVNDVKRVMLRLLAMLRSRRQVYDLDDLEIVAMLATDAAARAALERRDTESARFAAELADRLLADFERRRAS